MRWLGRGPKRGVDVYGDRVAGASVGTINRYLGDFEEESWPAALVGDFKIKCLRFHTEVTESMASVGEEKQNSVTGL